MQNLRSGEWITSFTNYSTFWSPERFNHKIAFAPLHTAQMPGMLIRATLLAAPRTTFAYHPVRGYVHTPTDGEIGGDREGERFYIMSIVLPRAGRWMLVVTAGPDWGCFVITLPDRRDEPLEERGPQP